MLDADEILSFVPRWFLQMEGFSREGPQFIVTLLCHSKCLYELPFESLFLELWP